MAERPSTPPPPAEAAAGPADGLQVDVGQDWEANRSRIRRVLQLSGTTNPFMSFEWLSTWWKYWGKGKRLQLFFFDRGGTTVGFVPLFSTRSMGVTNYYVVGHRTSNYLDVVSAPGEQEAVLRALCRTLAERRSPTLLNLMDVSSASPTYEALRALAGDRTVGLSFYRLYTCPFAALGEDWQKYFAGVMGRKHRSQVRSAARRLAGLGDVRLRVLADAGPIEDMLPKVRAIHEERFRRQYNNALGDRKIAFLQELLPSMSGNAIALVVLELDEEPIAFLLGLKSGSVLIDYIQGFDPAFERYSPGNLLIFELTEWLVSAGYEALDFSKGDEVYKRRWSTGETENYLALIAIGSGIRLGLYLWRERLRMGSLLWLRRRGYNRTIKRFLGTVRWVLRGPRSWRPVRSRVRQAAAASPGAGVPVRYRMIKDLPLGARGAVLDFCHAHHRGEVRLEDGNGRRVTVRDERTHEAIEVSW